MAKHSLGTAYAMKRRNKGASKVTQVQDAKAQAPSENEDIVEAILAKRKMATGGMVENAGQVDDQFLPINQFSEHGEPNDVDSPGPDKDREGDDQDLVGQILKSRKKRE